jgi:hypothetical protein
VHLRFASTLSFQLMYFQIVIFSLSKHIYYVYILFMSYVLTDDVETIALFLHDTMICDWLLFIEETE